MLSFEDGMISVLYEAIESLAIAPIMVTSLDVV
jgi:hypothetical protein